MTDEVDEQLEDLKKWWKDNGAYVIIGLVVGIALVVAYYWRDGAQKAANEEAAIAYHEFKDELLDAKDAEKGKAEASKLLGALREDHGDHGYAALASMLMASKNVVDKEYKVAAADLQWVLDNQAESPYEPLARTRLARLQVQMDDCDAASKTLTAGNPGGFEGLYAQIQGYCLQQGGNVKAARESYEQALQHTERANQYPIEWQLNELGEE